MIDAQTSRLSRLIAILLMLQTKKIVTSTEISEKFGISIRTVYRDIRALEQAGVPIYVEEGKGYSLMEGFSLPPIMFTESEANALITAEQLILKNKDASLIKNYTAAINKIKAVLKFKLKDNAELLSKRIIFRQNPQNDTSSNHLSSIQIALTNFNLINLSYYSLEKSESTLRLIEPFALYNTQENWILIAWCRLRKDYRAFRLDRITKLDVLDETFDKHKISLQQYFILCKKNSSSPDIGLS